MTKLSEEQLVDFIRRCVIDVTDNSADARRRALDAVGYVRTIGTRGTLPTELSRRLEVAVDELRYAATQIDAALKQYGAVKEAADVDA